MHVLSDASFPTTVDHSTTEPPGEPVGFFSGDNRFILIGCVASLVIIFLLILLSILVCVITRCVVPIIL